MCLWIVVIVFSRFTRRTTTVITSTRLHLLLDLLRLLQVQMNIFLLVKEMLKKVLFLGGLLGFTGYDKFLV